MYDIRIITDFGERSLDFNDPSFPYTFESSSVAELQDQSASWSYTITIPRTANNEAILGSAGVPFVRSYTPYAKRLCNVYVNGVQIIKRGVMFIDNTTRTKYEVQIVSGNADVFERMQDVTFENWENVTKVTLPYRHYPTDEELEDLPYDYMRNTYISREKQYTNRQILPTFAPTGVYRYARPYVFVGSPTNERGMLKRVLDYFGLTLQTDTPNSELDAMWLTITEDKYISNGRTIDTSVTFNEERGTSGYVQVQGERIYSRNNEKTTTEINFEWSSSTKQNGAYTSLQVLTAYLNAGGEITMIVTNDKSEALAEVTINKNNWNGDEILRATLSVQGGYQYLIPRVIVRDDVSYQLGSVRYETISSSYATQTLDTQGRNASESITYVTNPEDVYDGDGATINLEASTGIDTPFDFLKMLAQIFGWIISVKGNTIRAYTFGYIKSNKIHAYNWSEKLLRSSDEQTQYQFGDYARVNRIVLGENSEIPYTDIAIFDISDMKLEPQTDIIEISATSHIGNIVELWKRTSEDEVVTPYDWEFEWAGGGGGTHIVLYESDTNEIEPYTTQFIKANYQPLIDTLQSVQVKNVQMLLTPYDVQTFDPYIPVFLRPYGAYYYVNKISDWEDGKPCSVELLKI